MTTSSLNGSFALVTGATSGIGLAIAKSLAAQGAKLFVVGRDATRLDQAKHAIGGDADIVSVACDLESESDIQTLSSELARHTRRLDILVHSAGWISLGDIASLTSRDFDRHYHINTRAPLLLTNAMLPFLKSAQGQIVFINSSVGLRTKAGVGAYAASKHALRAIADTLRAEINTFGVRVTSVYPGNTATPMQASILAASGRTIPEEHMLQPSDVAAVVMHALLLPRTAEITDIHVRPFRKAGDPAG